MFDNNKTVCCAADFYVPIKLPSQTIKWNNDVVASSLTLMDELKAICGKLGIELNPDGSLSDMEAWKIRLRLGQEKEFQDYLYEVEEEEREIEEELEKERLAKEAEKAEEQQTKGEVEEEKNQQLKKLKTEADSDGVENGKEEAEIPPSFEKETKRWKELFAWLIFFENTRMSIEMGTVLRAYE